MIDYGDSDTMIEISGKMDKPSTYKDLVVVIFHSFILRISSDEIFFSFYTFK